MRARLILIAAAATFWSAAAICLSPDSDRPGSPVARTPGRALAVKADPWVLDRLRSDGETEALVVLRSQADL